MSKLSSEEQELLAEFVSHDGFKLFLREATQALELIQRDIITSRLESPADERELVLRKARADGAAQLLDALQSRVQKIRKKHA